MRTRLPPYVRTSSPGLTSLVGRAEEGHRDGVRAVQAAQGAPAVPEVCPYIAASTATLAVGRSQPSRAATGA